jgi:hypothetical protein
MIAGRTSRTHVWLQTLLILSGLLLLLAVIPVFFSIRTMSFIHEWLGMGEFPDRPITVYLARSTSALYAMQGAIMIFVGLRLRQLWIMVPLIAVLHLWLGLTLLCVDLTAPMPWYWTCAEGPSVIAVGLVFLWLWKIEDGKMDRAAGRAEPSFGNDNQL